MFRLFAARNQPQNQAFCPPSIKTTLDARIHQSAAHQYSEMVRTQVFRRVQEGVPLNFSVSGITDTTARVHLFPQGTPRYATLRFSTPANVGDAHIELNLGSTVVRSLETTATIHDLIPNTLYIYQVIMTYAFSNNLTAQRTYIETRIRQFRTHGAPVLTEVTGNFDGLLQWPAAQINEGESVSYLVSLLPDTTTEDPNVPEIRFSSYTSYVNLALKSNVPFGAYTVTVTSIYNNSAGVAPDEPWYISTPIRINYYL